MWPQTLVSSRRVPHFIWQTHPLARSHATYRRLSDLIKICSIYANYIWASHVVFLLNACATRDCEPNETNASSSATRLVLTPVHWTNKMAPYSRQNGVAATAALCAVPRNGRSAERWVGQGRKLILCLITSEAGVLLSLLGWLLDAVVASKEGFCRNCGHLSNLHRKTMTTNSKCIPSRR
jgi:hypothetical protein